MLTLLSISTKKYYANYLKKLARQCSTCKVSIRKRGLGTAAILDSVLVVNVIEANLNNKIRSFTGTCGIFIQKHFLYQLIVLGESVAKRDRLIVVLTG